jgi:DNA-binding XRE family transcriptional regulator
MQHVTGEQLRAARAMARIEQSALAERADVSIDTIKRLEKTVGPVSATIQTVNSVVRVLEAAGVEFTNGDQPGVRMMRKGGQPTLTGPDPFKGGDVQGQVTSRMRRPARERPDE